MLLSHLQIVVNFISTALMSLYVANWATQLKNMALHVTPALQTETDSYWLDSKRKKCHRAFSFLWQPRIGWGEAVRANRAAGWLAKVAV